MNKIFFLCGKSSSGKDTLYKELKKLKHELQPVVLYTTRPLREGERDGIEYHFITRNQLEEYEVSGKVIERRAYDTVHGIWEYATIDDGLVDLDKNSYLAIGTLESLIKLQDYYGKEAIIPLYIEVPDEIRLQRALDREKAQKVPKYKELCRRFLADEEDFTEGNLLKAGISKRFVNKDMLECLQEMVEVIDNGKL